jgi:multidrug efflux system membrane fusion protein
MKAPELRDWVKGDDLMESLGNMTGTRLGAGLFALLMAAGCTTRAESTAAPTPPQVPVVAAEERSMIHEAHFTGRVEAVHRVDLRPRVSGSLDAVLYREGAYVTAGTPLFQIDRRPYDIAVSKAAGELAATVAQLRRAKTELERAERLINEDAISSEEVTRRQSEVETLTARVEAARAAHADALLNLEFTVVKAPVSGRVGRAEVTPGNLLIGGPADGTRLARLNSVDPMYVYFDLDPATAERARHSSHATWRARVSSFESGTVSEGPVDFVDNGVSAQAGTLKVRARLSNPSGRLLPDSVVKVAFQFGGPERHTMVPEVAIGTDQGSRSVLIVTPAGELEQRPVTIGAKSGGWRAVLHNAVKPGEHVLLPGRPGLRPGMQVQPVAEVLQ